jgi:hypothetical protein
LDNERLSALAERTLLGGKILDYRTLRLGIASGR